MFILFNIFKSRELFDVNLLALNVENIKKQFKENVMNPKISTWFLKGVSHFLNLKPAPMIEGSGSVKRIANYCIINKYRKALIVTTQSLIELGLLEGFFESFKKNGLEYIVYDNVNGEPNFVLAKNILDFSKNFNPDVVVAIGGGSVLDVAKLIAAALTDPNRPLEKFVGILKVRKKLKPLIAVPTTAGTGSETTFIAVITDAQGIKRTVVSPKIIPSLAVLDGELLVSLPKTLTASTGIDALSHAVESYISTCTKKAHDFYAPTAINMIFNNLKNSYENPDNLVYRNKMLKASYLAGVSMNNEMVGYAHAFAHQLGAHYHIPHGNAIAMTLVRVLQFQLNTATKKLAELASFCGFVDEGESEQKAAEIFIKKVAELISSLNLHQTCEKLKKEDYESIIENAFYETARRYPVSRFMTHDEAVAFLDSLKEEI